MNLNNKKIKQGFDIMDIIGVIFLAVGIIIIIPFIMLFIKSENKSFIILMPAVIGLAIIAFGIGYLFAGRKRHKRISEIIETGNFVLSKVVNISQKSFSFLSMRRTFSVIECEYINPTTGTAHKFFSANLREKPHNIIMGSEVKVFVDTQDFSVYHVDIFNGK